MSRLDHLLDSQKAEIAAVIVKHAVSPKAFGRSWIPGRFAGYVDADVPAVIYKPQRRFFFAFAPHIESDIGGGARETGLHTVRYEPANQSRHMIEAGVGWPRVRSLFRDWLDFVKREVEAPYFEDILASFDGVSFQTDDSQSFTDEEREALSAGIEDLMERVEQLKSLHDDDMATLRAELDELKAELGRMKRGQWWKFAAGTLVKIAVADLIDLDVLQGWWAALREAAADFDPPNLLPS